MWRFALIRRQVINDNKRSRQAYFTFKFDIFGIIFQMCFNTFPLKFWAEKKSHTFCVVYFCLFNLYFWHERGKKKVLYLWHYSNEMSWRNQGCKLATHASLYRARGQFFRINGKSNDYIHHRTWTGLAKVSCGLAVRACRPLCVTKHRLFLTVDSFSSLSLFLLCNLSDITNKWREALHYS